MTDYDPTGPEAQALTSWLADLRSKAGLSQEHAAETIGVSAREIRRWETKNAPGSINLLRLLSAYGVRFDQQPPNEIPGAVNAELHALRLSLEELDRRLGRLEGRAERQGKATTSSLDDLAAGVQRIETLLDAQDPPASRRQKPA